MEFTKTMSKIISLQEKRFICLLLFVLPTLLFGQHKSRDLLYGDKYFKIHDYYLAGDYYEKALFNSEDTSYVHYQLGECDRLTYKYEEAEVHYSLVLRDENFPLAPYYYALMLKSNGRYEQALDEYNRFLANNNVDEEYVADAKLDRDGTLYILEEQKKAFREYNFENLGATVNTVESDFAPSIYNHDSLIVISSARFNKKHEEVYGRLGGSFLDNYIFEKTTDTSWALKNSLQKFDHLNTKYHDAAGTFNTEHDAYFFTKCDEKGTNRHEYHCAVYVSELEDGEWGDAKKLNENINKKDSWNAHPSLSLTEDTLYFASKREGGIGATDIWYSVKESNDLVYSWGEAVNLGRPVNTEHVDMSPQYNKDEQVLVFSSNGHVGFGGLDVLVARGRGLKKIKNLGLPFNSSHDDFHFVMGDSIGYLSSNRVGSIGSDDIYSFDLYSSTAHLAVIEKSEDERYDHVDMSGKISAIGEAKQDSVEIVVTDTLGNMIKSVYTDKDGRFMLEDINLQDKREVIIELPEVHLLSDYNYMVDSLAFEVKSSIVLVPSNDTTTIDLGGQVLDDKGKPIAGQKVILLDDKGVEIMHTLTNEKGEFMFRSLDGSKEYTLKLEDKDQSISNIQIFENRQGINTESIEDAEKGVASRIKTESIYFDFTKSDIRKEAGQTLKEVAMLLNEYPNVSLELHGYTDNYGSSEFNIILGEKRGNSALRFLQSYGINKSRIQVKTHGESEPVATNETFEGRQLNRRVDFYILGGVKYNQRAQVHILKPGTTLNEVAKEYNMTLEELNALNNLSNGEKVDSYSPIRVKKNDAVTTSVNQNVASRTATETKTSLEDFKYIIKNSAGNTIRYRAEADNGFYTVMTKNTLYSIATICKVTVDEVKKWNDLKSNIIFAGQILKVSEDTKMTKKEYLENHIASLPTIENDNSDMLIMSGYAKYMVKKNDDFNEICSLFNMNKDEFKALNDLVYNVLPEGKFVKVKAK